jgi:hypothetical protein
MCGNDFEPDSLGLRIENGKLQLIYTEVWGHGIDQHAHHVMDSIPCRDIVDAANRGDT